MLPVIVSGHIVRDRRDLAKDQDEPVERDKDALDENEDEHHPIGKLGQVQASLLDQDGSRHQDDSQFDSPTHEVHQEGTLAQLVCLRGLHDFENHHDDDDRREEFVSEDSWLPATQLDSGPDHDHEQGAHGKDMAELAGDVGEEAEELPEGAGFDFDFCSCCGCGCDCG